MSSKHRPQVHSVTLTAWMAAAKKRSVEVLERGVVVLHECGRVARFRTVNAAAAALCLSEAVWEPAAVTLNRSPE